MTAKKRPLPAGGDEPLNSLRSDAAASYYSALMMLAIFGAVVCYVVLTQRDFWKSAISGIFIFLIGAVWEAGMRLAAVVHCAVSAQHQAEMKKQPIDQQNAEPVDNP